MCIGEKIIPVDSPNLGFRLFKPDESNNINLELLAQYSYGVSTLQEYPLVGLGRKQKVLSYTKPIGYYTQSKTFLSKSIEITILGEFEDDLELLIKAEKFNPRVKIHKLSFIKNALLAAFSIEAFINAQDYKDILFVANGLNLDIFMTYEGYPQVFLDDKYNIDGPLAGYLLKEHGSIGPIEHYQDMHDELNKMRLMTVYKIL